MNPRERHIAAMTFGDPDRIPFTQGWPRQSTLAAWHEQGLPRGAQWDEYSLETLGIEKEKAGPQLWPEVEFR